MVCVKCAFTVGPKLPSIPNIRLHIPMPNGNTPIEPQWNLQCTQHTAISGDIMYEIEWLIDGVQVMKDDMFRNDTIPNVAESILPGDVINNMTSIHQVYIHILSILH